MKNQHKTILALAAILTPLSTNAAQVTLKTLMALVADYLNTALELLMGLAVLFFVWYVIKYFIRSGDSKERTEASQYVLWSIIGFFVILSFWGLVNILSSTFNLNTNAPSMNNINSLFPR
ncbi:MAG: pilin [Candidatus Paceibacterota bacterium]|jgi:hypothetical protein